MFITDFDPTIQIVKDEWYLFPSSRSSCKSPSPPPLFSLIPTPNHNTLHPFITTSQSERIVILPKGIKMSHVMYLIDSGSDDRAAGVDG